jgi:tryptophan synthase beta subunit
MAVKSNLLQDKDGQVEIAHSIAAGLDYPVSDRNIPITSRQAAPVCGGHR